MSVNVTDHPQRPAGAGPLTGDRVSESALARFGGWLAHAPAERAPLLTVPAVWTAADIMHAVGVSGWFTGGAALAAAAIGFGLGERRQQGPHRRLNGRELAAAAGLTGTWVTVAARWGPLAGPDHLLTILYGLGTAGGYWWLRAHGAVKSARARRDQAAAEAAAAAAEAAAAEARRAAWHRLAAQIGIPSAQKCHLLDWSETPLGERWSVSTVGTGRTAASLASGDLAERIAERGGVLTGDGSSLPPGRVTVRPATVAGRLEILVRSAADPWTADTWHPEASGVLDSGSPFAELVAGTPSIGDPVVLGVDPETRAPMLLPLREAVGARHVLVVGATGAGKTMTLDNIRLHVAKCADARFFQINLVKQRAERVWVPLAEASVLAGDPDADARALAILDFLAGVIARRTGGGTQTGRMHRPTPDEPQFVLFVDELRGMVADPDRKERLHRIISAGRENGVSLVLAGQRPVQQEIGGTTVRANTNYYVYGAMMASDKRRGHGSDEIELPDMGGYGEGAAGVFGVAMMHAGAASLVAQGRAFRWSDDGDGLARVIAALAADHHPYDLEQALAADDQTAELFAAVTGAGPMPAGDRYDVTATRAGETVPGVQGVKGKLGSIRAWLSGAPPAADDPDDDDPGNDQGALSQDARTVLAVLRAAPEGMSARARAEALPWQKTKVHELLAELAAAGLVRVVGEGRNARFVALAPAPAATVPVAAYPPLRVVPDPAKDVS